MILFYDNYMKKPIEAFKTIEEEKKNLEFLPSGFSLLDRVLDGGFLKREFVVIGAFTGIGKSIFGGQLLFQVAQKGFKTAYFSLEISNEMIISRIVGQLANIKPTRIIAGLLEVDEYDAKAQAKAKVIVHNDDIDLYDDLYILSEIIEAIKKNDYEFVVIDFIQNIQLLNGMDEYTRLNFVSIELQKLAKEKNVCIVILSQLSNRVGREGSKIIEFKGSGGIAIRADLGFILTRDEVESIEENTKQKVQLKLMKNRRGISGQRFDFKFIHPGGLLEEQV
jgi:replicative DNA helicase